MTSKRVLPEDQKHERLVAYLDGELSAEESEALESELGSSDEIRSALRDFDRAWNALDALPLSNTEPDFAKSTVAMVAAEAAKEVAQKTTELPVLQKRARRNSWLLVLGGALLGAMLVWAVNLRKDRLLIVELPVVDHATVIAQVDDIEFLKRLAQEKWLLRDSSYYIGAADCRRMGDSS